MTITVYSKPNCVPCANLKMWLKLKGIDYQEQSLMDNIDRIRDAGFMAAPVVDIDGQLYNGANISNIADIVRGQHVESALSNA